MIYNKSEVSIIRLKSHFFYFKKKEEKQMEEIAKFDQKVFPESKLLSINEILKRKDEILHLQEEMKNFFREEFGSFLTTEKNGRVFKFIIKKIINPADHNALLRDDCGSFRLLSVMFTSKNYYLFCDTCQRYFEEKIQGNQFLKNYNFETTFFKLGLVFLNL